jgi:DNA-binding transcriptional ArsR family regulator
MQSHVVQLDQIFQALSDQNCRAIFERLARGFCATSEHAKPFAMALSSFIQPLNVLERCGLAASRKKCRVRIWELQRETLAATGRWLAAQYRIRE